MLKDKDNQLSIYSILYNKIPENHTLKLINSAIDLSFVTKLLEGSYSKTLGRPAKEPELLIRILIIKHLYNLSDVRTRQGDRCTVLLNSKLRLRGNSYDCSFLIFSFTNPIMLLISLIC